MGSLLRNIRAVLVLTFAVSPSSWAATTTCTGKFMDPITDICWSCAFPLKVGGTTIMDFGQEDFDSGVSNPLCACSSPPKVGLSISFYEPARLVEVVRKPYCFPSLGGESFGIVLIEAMAAGVLVVLGGNNPGYTSVLGERPETLFDPKDISQLALKLERFMSDERLASSVHEWQQTHVRNYDIETVGPKILKLYNETIDKRALSGHN